MARAWGPWTEVKLEALENYLAAFTTASARAKGTLYLDLFAGAPENEMRDGRRPLVASPERALEVQPPFTKLIFCELQPRSATSLRRSLGQRFPGRDITVLAGDCNKTMPPALASLAEGWRYAPTFAFLDQFSAQVTWQTIEALARFKAPEKWKTELWLFFPDALIPRGAYQVEGQPRFEEFAHRVDLMYGTADWRVILRGRHAGVLTAPQARSELLNLMRWRLERTLGYKATLPLTVTNGNGTPIYTMVHATDHQAGISIMTSVLRAAGERLEHMRAEAKIQRRAEREEERGVLALFPEDAAALVDRSKLNETFEPPRPPWGWMAAGDDLG